VLASRGVSAFWGSETEQFKGAFVVSFYSSTPRQVADPLNVLPGVRKAYSRQGAAGLGCDKTLSPG
jgi:hypothetical protein